MDKQISPSCQVSCTLLRTAAATPIINSSKFVSGSWLLFSLGRGRERSHSFASVHIYLVFTIQHCVTHQLSILSKQYLIMNSQAMPLTPNLSIILLLLSFFISIHLTPSMMTSNHFYLRESDHSGYAHTFYVTAEILLLY